MLWTVLFLNYSDFTSWKLLNGEYDDLEQPPSWENLVDIVVLSMSLEHAESIYSLRTTRVSAIIGLFTTDVAFLGELALPSTQSIFEGSYISFFFL